jgi:hypothetical protein
MAKSRDETVTRVKATAIEASIPCPKAGNLTPNAVVNEAHRVLTGERYPLEQLTAVVTSANVLVDFWWPGFKVQNVLTDR